MEQTNNLDIFSILKKIREIEKICNEYNKMPNGTLETLLLFSKYNSNFFGNITINL